MAEFNATERPAAVRGLRSLNIGVVDLDRTVRFFTQIWGLSTVSTADGVAYLRASGPDHYVIALHSRLRTEVLRIDLRAASTDEIGEMHARLANRGAAGLTAPAELQECGGGYGFSVCDPEGRRLLILADDESHADVADAIDKPRKLSHVVVNTAAAGAIEEFYVGALGFRLVDRTRRMSFLNCNSDHHSIAVVPAERNTLNHVAFEMPSFDAVMRGIGRLRDAGFDIGWGAGRHGPGNNIFAYFAGVERLPLEYTAEVQQIDETYRVGSPEDWKPVPGRMDQWGATSAPTQALVEAEHTIEFSSDLLQETG
jgi:catechol-2,3-dioxygenase